LGTNSIWGQLSSEESTFWGRLPGPIPAVSHCQHQHTRLKGSTKIVLLLELLEEKCAK